MRAQLRLTFVLAACVAHVASFFDFLKSSPPKPDRVVQHVDTNAVRGAPEHLHARYLADPFICDGRPHDRAIVNDGYCDCVDKSDEPGTSACEGTIFHCINKGYKMVKIPSSRVDDQVCDCCDGSDEGRVVSCANTCNEAAEKERAQLLKVTTNYKTGSAIRDELIRRVQAEKAQLAASVTPIGMEIHRLREDNDAVQKELDEKSARVTSLEGTVAAEQRAILRTHLLTDALDFTNAAHFLSNLLKTLKVPEYKALDTITASTSSATSSSATSARAGAPPPETVVEPTSDDDVDEVPPQHFGDEDVDPEDPYAEEETTNLDSEAHTESGVADSTGTDSASTAPTCPIVDATGDAFLKPLCAAVTSVDEAIDALVNVMLKRRAYHEAMLLLGHFRLHQTFLGSDIFAAEQIAASPDTCPAIFEAILPDHTGASHCSLKGTVENAVAAVETHYGLTELRAEVEALRTRVRDGNTKINDAENRLRAARSANDDVAKYQDHLEYLALKDQCFDKEDGAFIYSLCILGSIKQKEVVGHREVTLGTFQSFEPGYEGLPAMDGVVPSVVMKFGKGDHCHAFGARTATVTVSCAAQHALISATEPSTCAYKLHFESPAACTPKYAEVSGISSMTTM